MGYLAILVLAVAALFGCSAPSADGPSHHWRERGFDSKADCYEHHRRIGGNDMSAERLRWWCGE